MIELQEAFTYCEYTISGIYRDLGKTVVEGTEMQMVFCNDDNQIYLVYLK